MRELNKLTQKLLGEGWTRDQTPPGCKPWNDFYGGWEYTPGSRRDCVFETPCGLLYKRAELSYSGTMYYRGIEWTEENDLLTTICPYYGREETCEKNHPLLEANRIAGSCQECLHFCAVHETDRPYAYESSAQRVKDEAEAEAERLWKAFSQSRGGRVCKLHCRFNRRTKEWSMRYDPEECARLRMQCRWCSVLQREIDPKKGKVYCDERRTYTVKGEGLFPDEERVVVTKGIKVTKRPVSLTLCEVIAKRGAPDFTGSYIRNRSWAGIRDPSLKIELENFRVTNMKGPVRDLLQDLRDVEAGITVVHASDQDEAAKAKKKERLIRAREARERKKQRLTGPIPAPSEREDEQMSLFL